MAKITFIKPALETDAVWDPIRTSPYLGIWYLASDLKAKRHCVKYIDEVVRDNGLEKHSMFTRELVGERMTENPLEITYEQFNSKKMQDYASLSTDDFIKKYSAFNTQGAVVRTMVRTGNPEGSTIKLLSNDVPDIVGIPLISSANYLPAARLAKAIKNAFPKTKIVFGGQHTLYDRELKDEPYVDHVVIGDAIGAMDKILEGNAPKSLYGGYQLMDRFPLLDPSIIADVGYPKEPTHTYPTYGRKSTDFMFSKGCFRNCNFCVAGSQKENHVTAIDYERVAKQLKIFKDAEVQELVLQDDAFLWDKRHVQYHLPAILGLMKKEGLYWQNNGGVEFEAIDDFVTEQLIHYNSYGEGRVTSLYVPFNPRAWNKESSASKSMSGRYHQNLGNLKKLREEAGIYVFTSAIIGTPEQTKETIREELDTDKKLVQEGYLDAALCLSATMLPATDWYKTNGHNIINKKDWAGYSLFTTHHRTENLTAQEIEASMLNWVKTLDPIQKTYRWNTAFPNEVK